MDTAAFMAHCSNSTIPLVDRARDLAQNRGALIPGKFIQIAEKLIKEGKKTDDEETKQAINRLKSMLPKTQNGAQ